MTDPTIEAVKQACDEVYTDNPVLARLALTQAILESRLASKPSKLALDCFNLFGIKDTDERGYKEYWTTECSKGVCRKVVQRFECYTNYMDCINHHKWLMNRPRYVKVLESKTIADACVQVAKAGYATDPNYSAKLQYIYNVYVDPLYEG